MFDRRATKTLMSIHDDRAGQGTDLAFPSMSTCSAVVCVLADRLVGIHKTRVPAADLANLFDYALKLIAGDTVYLIVIAGWVTSEEEGNNFHYPKGIRQQLKLNEVPTYYFNYETGPHVAKSGQKVPMFKPDDKQKMMINLCTFASHNGKEFPHISFKRSSKVRVTNVDRGRGYGSVDEPIRSSHDHLINQSEFTKLG